MDRCVYSRNQVCEMLGISVFTIRNWYEWQRKQLNNGDISEAYLPTPKKMKNVQGQPLMWSLEMVEQLRKYQSGIIRGRNGIYGKYTNAAWH